ncbi:hypothetical protein K4F52_007348 [Lecanicillium sp. MT-2017a]|nr:hypothetical protein K4F52_007348 [Lecanicillium sp. MT-2017a]
MANGFDRLERLFAYKRKGSLPACEPISPTKEIEQQFPSPSFIRPKAARMCARDETRLRHASGRSPSVPDILDSRGSMRGHSRNGGSTGSSCTQKRVPLRSPSLNSGRKDRFAPGLQEFKFPARQTPNSEAQSTLSSQKSSSEVPRIPSPRSRSPLHLSILPNRTDTPPSSDPEDDHSPRASPRSKKLPELPYAAPPTPGESPELGPLPELPTLRHSQSADALEKTMLTDIRFEMNDLLDDTPLQRSQSQTSLAVSIPASTGSSVLREPDLNDFLNLSDDEVAEDADHELEPVNDPQSTLPPMDLSISSKPLASTLLTLTPPRASQPATAAAFEAARIARRYDFDLVYVVNLWPGSPMPWNGSPLARDTDDAEGERPLIGRLLAAHGLHHVPSPLQISSLVHTTILRSDGWIEYRNPEARQHDLARGYACAFYTGQYSRSVSGDRSTPVSGVRLSEQIDRGIVFAAYRKPRAGDCKLGRTFTECELGDLHREAESLVEMLIDIHVTNRLRQPPTCARATEETGPMPLQQLVAA